MQEQVMLLSEADQAAVRTELDRVLKSAPFRQSQRRQRFLQFIVEETLASRGDRLKAYTIAVEVFERPESFDAQTDPMVRIEAGRLRDKLREFYAAEGQSDPVQIELPKGSYAPLFEFPKTPLPAPAKSADEKVAEPVTNPAQAHVLTRDHDATARPRSDAPVISLLKMEPKRLGLLAAGMVLVLAAGLWTMRGRSTQVPQSAIPSIAVLPLENIGTDATWSRLADGMTEDIITDLSHSKALSVIARSSTGHSLSSGATSRSTAPSDHTSERASDPRPAACSGLM